MSSEEKVPDRVNGPDPISFGQYRNPAKPGAVPAVSMFCDLTSVESLKTVILDNPQGLCDLLDDIVENGWDTTANKGAFRRYVTEAGIVRPRTFETAAERELKAAAIAEALDARDQRIAELEEALASK